MPTEITLPALGESVTEGTVVRWLKEVGDTVTAEEPLLEVSTDKVDTEVPSPVAGILLKIAVAEDETAAVGAILGLIGEDAEQSSANLVPSPDPVVAATDTESSTVESVNAEAQQEESGPVPVAHRRVYATPRARTAAVEHGLGLEMLGTPGIGRGLRLRDVLDAVAARAGATIAPAGPVPVAPTARVAAGTLAKLRGRTEKLSRLRRTIAARMVESLRVSAQLTTVVEVDVTEIARLRARHQDSFRKNAGVALSYLPFFAKAAAEALKVHPRLNASLSPDGKSVTYHPSTHLGIAVDTDKGLFVPVISDAGDLSIAGLARRIADIAERTRANRIAPDELSGGTFTITNTGSRGALFDTPIINQPQVAILGTGSVTKRPVVVTDRDGDEGIAIRSMVYLALTYDHRLVDGADAARFLTHIKQRLEGAAFESEVG
ncbi:2-oxoglutarate dehydrogenase, E2 component, dihydrolipoamide succinyltransferase [Nocardia carnea]|uniref:2-oxoglutarate dehydrogenase, E2 component, dihydrolipoamide succinyltransferase n=1 Tax=Nocardia carnea TaxID=37328 RepID=UPI002458CA7F|nr:2-oxoglutarate dehydrogenase, E2 component, dihydrolipoamide succinyltransferase [Nocardia carnea]